MDGVDSLIIELNLYCRLSISPPSPRKQAEGEVEKLKTSMAEMRTEMAGVAAEMAAGVSMHALTSQLVELFPHIVLFL